MPTLSAAMYKYVYCSTVQMFTQLGSISDINLTFDVRVTTNKEHLNEHYKVRIFVFVIVLCSAAIR
jgi:hypothetical protein